MFFKICTVSVLLIFAANAPSYAQSSTYVGTWQFSFSGQDSGNGTAVVDANGNITGSGVSHLAGDITVTGIITPDGAMEMTAVPRGMASTGARFTGHANQKGKATGNWNNTYARMRGQWNANHASSD